jgi:hypothetical protein
MINCSTRGPSELLLPPSLREWLREDHLAWFVIMESDTLIAAAPQCRNQA